MYVGTNNLGKNGPLHIAEAIVEIVNTLKKNDAQIVMTRLLPRGMCPCTTREDITSVNLYLENLLHNHAPKALYVAPESDWTHPDGRLNMKFFFRDKLHLSEEGYRKFSLYILMILASTSQSFANSSPTYEYAIGEFEALSSSIISPEHSHVLCNEVSSESFLLCQDDFPSLSTIRSSPDILIGRSIQNVS